MSLHICLFHSDKIARRAANGEHPLLLIHVEGHMTDKLDIHLRLKPTHMAAVVIRVLLSIAALGRDGADDVLGVGAHQLHRVHSQVLVQVSTALSSIGAQVAFVFSLFCVQREMPGQSLLATKHFSTHITGKQLVIKFPRWQSISHLQPQLFCFWCRCPSMKSSFTGQEIF